MSLPVVTQVRGRVLSAVGANVARVLVMQGGNVLLVPVFLRYWGSELYGEWLVLSAGVAYLAILDLGLQTYVVNRMCQAYATARLDELHRDLHSSLRVYLIVVGFGLLCVGAAVVVVPIDRILVLRVVGPRAASWAVVFLAANTLLFSIPLGLIFGVYRATGAYTRGQMIGTGVLALVVIVTGILVWAGASLPAVAGSWLALNAVFAAIVLFELRHFRPDIRIGFELGTLSHGLSLLGPSLLFVVLNLATVINLQGVVLVLNRSVSGAAIAQFTTTRTLTGLIIQTAGIFSTAWWPELTAAEARRDVAWLRSVCRSIVKMNVCLAVLGALVLRIEGPTVYRVWTGRQLTLDPVLFDIFLVQAVLMVFWSSSGLVLIACNRQRAYASWMFANALTTIALAIVFVKPWGAVGVAVASLIGDLVCCAWVVPYLACRMLGDAPWPFWRVALVPGLGIGLVVGAVTEWIRPVADPTGSASWLWALSVAATYLAAVYWLWMDGDERRHLRYLRQQALEFVSP